MTHDLAPFVTAFLVRYLPAERNVSPHTIAAYRDTLKLLLRFVATALHRAAAVLQVEDLTPDRILQFLTDLETARGNTVRTRNARSRRSTPSFGTSWTRSRRSRSSDNASSPFR